MGVLFENLFFKAFQVGFLGGVIKYLVIHLYFDLSHTIIGSFVVNSLLL